MSRRQVNMALLAGMLAATTATAFGQVDTTAVEVAAPEVAPALIAFIEADYPAAALREGREGTVLLDLLVTAEGTVDSVAVARSLAPDLDGAAAAAARRLIFSPALADGEPVPVYVQFEYTFSLHEQARRIPDVVNFRGRLREMGTRAAMANAMVVASFPDSGLGLDLGVPWPVYLQRIGSLAGQYLEEDRLVALTDDDGYFEYRALPPGRVRLTFPNAGYEALEVEVAVLAGERIDASYWLRRSRYNEYEIVVYGREEETQVTRQTLTVTEVERIPGFAGDVIKSVQALPGVARPTMDNPGAIVVRGSGNYDTRFFLDGVDIPLLFHYGGLKSTYSSLALASVDMYPGGFGTRYGAAVGGIVEVKGRPGRADRWHTVLDASLLDGSFHIEGPLAKNTTLLLTGRRSFIGEVTKAALESQDDVSLQIAPYYWDAVGRLDWNPDVRHHLFFTAFAAKDRMEMIVPDERVGSPEVNEAVDAIEMDVRFSRFILGWDAQLSSRLRNQLRVAAGRTGERGHFFGYMDYDGHGPLYSLRDELSYAANPCVTATAGLDYLWTPYTYDVTVAGWPTSSQSLNFGDRGLYANVELRPWRTLLITPGVRFDHYDHLDDDEVSIRTSARWQYAAGRTLTGSYGSYNQHPQPAGQSTDPVYGNPDLPPTTARQATLGHEWRLGDRLFFKAEGYHNTQDHIPAPTDSLDLNFVPDAEARMYGLEFLLRHEGSGGFFGWLAYSFGRSERRFARKPVPDLGDDWNPSDWVLHDMDQTHHLEAVGSWQLGGNWSFGSRLQYVSGVPTTPLLSFTSNQFEYDADTGDYVPIGGAYFSERVSPYVRVDLRVDKTWVKERSIWSVYLDLQNANYFVYNSPEGYTYNYDYSKRDEYGWIFMPALGLRVEY